MSCSKTAMEGETHWEQEGSDSSGLKVGTLNGRWRLSPFSTFFFRSYLESKS